MQSKLYIGNLNYQITESELQEAFESYGPIKEVYLPKDRETKRPRGFGFVVFEEDPSSSLELDKIIEETNGQPLKGRAMHVSVAREKRAG